MRRLLEMDDPTGGEGQTDQGDGESGDLIVIDSDGD